MYTKSIIQQTIEKLHEKDSFRIAIENLMEKYNIEDSVFIFKNGNMREVVEGYFVTTNEYDNLAEAISDCDTYTMAIRVIGENFQVGKVFSKLSECDENNKVFDLQRLETIR
jgi:hypothetical protein